MHWNFDKSYNLIFFQALANLKEMGFAEADILDALRINGNNQDTAVWLIYVDFYITADSIVVVIVRDFYYTRGSAPSL